MDAAVWALIGFVVGFVTASTLLLWDFFIRGD